MNLYTVFIYSRGIRHEMAVKAGNKILALNHAMENSLKSWRDKDGIERIEIIEDLRNEVLTSNDYK